MLSDTWVVISLWLVKTLHINLKTVSVPTIILVSKYFTCLPSSSWMELNGCHLTRRWFYQKLFSDCCVCCSMAKRWSCFTSCFWNCWGLEPSAVSSVNGVWATLLPLPYGVIQWRVLFAWGVEKTGHSTLRISSLKCHKPLLISPSLHLPSSSTSTQTHLH